MRRFTKLLHSENWVLAMVILSWLPVFYFYVEWSQGMSRLDFALGLVVICVGYGIALWYLRRLLRRPLLTLSNLLLSMQEGDYGLRARQYHGLIGDVMVQTNVLAETLKALRIGEREAHLLLSKMIASIDLAVFIFDHRQRLTLANPEAEFLMLEPESKLIGKSADQLGLRELMLLDGEVTTERQFPGSVGRWRVRHFVFFQDRQEHELLAVSNVSKLLVEEERSNWQKLLRVLGHELNNSLVPIKNMSETLESMVANLPADQDEMNADLKSGLGLIGRRADALHRFVQGYARLTKLPPPGIADVQLADLVARATALENAQRIEVMASPELLVQADADQVEQVLLNLVDNALDATEDNNGRIRIMWQVQGKYAQIDIEDHGSGIANPDNLFVPFFTTKPNGSGIGLVLCKQIVESHEGQLQLIKPDEHEGCIARLLLPLAS